jgi:hypothetical protein
MKIINDDSRANNKLETSLTDDARVIIHNHHMFIVKATGSVITNGREPRSCLGRVFNFKLGSFTDNTKIAQHANGHF